MNNSKEQTAEQKLLKMIEDNSASTGSSVFNGESAGVSPSLIGTVRLANKFLLLGSIVAVLFFAYSVKIGLDVANRDVTVEADSLAGQFSSENQSVLPIIQRLSFYLASIQQRDIFQPYETPRASGTKEVENRRLAKAIESYKLVGIAWFETVDTASVMIEDTRNNVTYFLKKGENLGNINVKTIYADGALLGQENEEIMIRYDK